MTTDNVKRTFSEMQPADTNMWTDLKAGYEFGQTQGKQKLEEAEAESRMPFATYNWILFKCFDTCIVDFDNKILDAAEGKCVDECTSNLKDAPEIFMKG